MTGPADRYAEHNSNERGGRVGDVGSLWDALDEQLIPLIQTYRQNLATLHVDRKADETLLSEADLATQTVIVETIMRHFPGSKFVAEEDSPGLPTVGQPTWIVDPIDGTAEFVSVETREFCCVVCRVEAGMPTAAYILAPELGADHGPVSVHWAERVTVNGCPVGPMAPAAVPRRASVTRSKGSSAREFEAELARAGCHMKVRTTSQTLDMVRSCLDLSPWTQQPQQQFDLFYRPKQKVWDGAAGIGLSLALGRAATNGAGMNPLPFDDEFLRQREPTFSETIVGAPDCVRWFVDLLARSRRV